MFDRKAYKKQALASLKGQWLDTCLLSTIFLAISGLAGCISIFGGLIISTSIWGILSVALNSVFMKFYSDSESQKISFSSFLDSLGTHWLASLLGALWFLLWTFLWSLLFIIPGIVKGYSYSMMFFVLAENPKIGVEKSMNISKVLTRGHKADLFSLHMSFFGWWLLCLFTSGVGFIALLPYFKMTNLNAYFDLKKMAFSERKLSPADFA